jgi:hypothetical protein
MSHLDILLPFGLPQEEMARDLMRALKAPALATLVGKGKAAPPESFDAFSRVLPHELWISRRFGLDGTPEQSPPLAATRLRALGQAASSGTWFILNPAHLHVARDHLVLTDLRQLALSDQDSGALFEAARPLFEESGMPLLYGDAANWFIRADDWAGLRTSTPDAACGHNIDIWMPQGSGERNWRKLQNEVQMLWHDHAINQARAERGLQPINALWLWGGSPGGAVRHATPYQTIFNPAGWSRDFTEPPNTGGWRCNAAELIGAMPESALLVLDDLIEPALSTDWGGWLDTYHRLESDWFAPLLGALQDGLLDRLSLNIGSGARLLEIEVSKLSLQKFWNKPSLGRLAP